MNEVRSEDSARRKARHLIDFDAPPQPRDPKDEARLQRVQRWVMSVLGVSTALHMAGIVIFTGLTMDRPTDAFRVVICLVAVGFGVAGVAMGLAIHRQRLASPWLALGVIPGVIGALLLF